ncbi:MAG: cysteine--tRNA ligase [Candidatus Jordarchaeales archaeon]
MEEGCAMLRVYNTLSRSKEPFEPVEPPLVRMYVCGPTVYDEAHMGHARTYVAFDTIRRILEFFGYEVFYVQNITDIDDKIINRAEAEGASPADIAERYSASYFRDMDALNVRRADVHPRVTDHMEDIIEAVARLIEKGVAYEADGNVYFEVSSFPHYGRLSGVKFEELIAGARVEPDAAKKNPADFALWKKERREGVGWSSPWGYGRPGWHIECSVMSTKYLGPRLDIHGGGQDLIFPHHENEIAQSESLTGISSFVKYWIHTGYLTIKGEKMSKSLGNYVTIREVLRRHSAGAVRLFLLSTHYRSPIDFMWEGLEAAESNLRYLVNTMDRLEASIRQAEMGSGPVEMHAKITENAKKFILALEDDFSTPVALSHMYRLARELNAYLDDQETFERGVLERGLRVIAKACETLGIVTGKSLSVPEIVEKLIKILVEVRSDARRRRDWKLADELREKLRESGVVLEDKGDKTLWKITR